MTLKPSSRFDLLLCMATALAVPGGCALAAEPSAPAEWSLSADGAYVLDLRAKLAWPRCVEGMRWTGKTCTGEPLLLDRAEATALATSRWQAEGIGWRLPRAAELQRLVDKSLSPPGLDPRLFPAAPGQWHWSATANVSAPSVNQYNYGNIAQNSRRDGARQAALINGWAVNLSTGEARGDAARASKLPVRLVRPQATDGSMAR
ncbi:DUF1566 domain-containing protein [Acidovorax sp.]|uniref:Lcl C-terminal domain-containing protein n=1 Tax=Acidovorax sp. TaxID=1872122 RepID=UPI003417E03B